MLLYFFTLLLTPQVQKYKDGEESSVSGSDVELLDNKLDSDGEHPRTLSASDDDDDDDAVDFRKKKTPTKSTKKPVDLMNSGQWGDFLK